MKKPTKKTLKLLDDLVNSKLGVKMLVLTDEKFKETFDSEIPVQYSGRLGRMYVVNEKQNSFMLPQIIAEFMERMYKAKIK